MGIDNGACIASRSGGYHCGMGFFSHDDSHSLPKNDRGAGSFRQYRYTLVPSNARVTLRLAESNPHQDELGKIDRDRAERLETAISRRTAEDEKTDAPVVIRLFAGGRVTGVVGSVPRGMESVVDEALSRLDRDGKKARIPVRLVRTRAGWRVDLLIGQTR